MVNKPSVYVMLLSNNQYYVGSTDNIARRLREHNHGKTKSTRFKRPVRLIFSEKFDSLVLARRVEYKIKRLKSRKIIEQIIKMGKIDTKLLGD